MIYAPKRHRTGCWLLPLVLVLSFGGGIALGLAVSWWLWPVQYVNVAPDSLKPAHRREYILLIGQAYAYDGNLEWAEGRLAGLGDLATVGAEVATWAEQSIAEGSQGEDVRTLARLAWALGHHRTALAAYLPEQSVLATWTPEPTATPLVPPTSTPSETPTPASTFTPAPTESLTLAATYTTSLTPEVTRQRPTFAPLVSPPPAETPKPSRVSTTTPSPQARYRVLEPHGRCESPGGLLTVTVIDADGQPQANVELLIRWSSGEDRFFTGLKPERGAGYADFQMEKGQTYQVTIIGTESDVAQGIVADACGDANVITSWDLTFQLTGATSP